MDVVSLREMTKGRCIHSAKHMLVFRWKSKEVSMCSYNVSMTRSTRVELEKSDVLKT